MRDALIKCTKAMSEENAVSLEQLQQMAAEQDRLSGYNEGENPPEVPLAEIQDRKESPSEAGKKLEESQGGETVAEPKIGEPAEGEAVHDLAEGPPEDTGSSLKSEATDTRLVKSESRLNDSWKKLNAKKGEVDEMKRELEELRSVLNDRAKPSEFVDEDGSTAADYEAAAKSFELDGQFGLAEQAKQQAQKVMELGRTAQTERVDDTFKKEWSDNFDRAADSYPELRESDSGFRKAVNGLLQERPVLATYSGGIVDAADIVAMKMASEQSGELQEQIGSLQEENAGLKSKLSIGGSDPTGAPQGPKEFNDLSTTEQFAELQRRAAEVDAAGGY